MLNYRFNKTKNSTNKEAIMITNKKKTLLAWAMFIVIFSFLIYRVHTVSARVIESNKTTVKKKCKKKHSCKKLKIQPIGKIKIIKKYAPTTKLTPEEQQQRYTIPQGETVTILDYKDPE